MRRGSQRRCAAGRRRVGRVRCDGHRAGARAAGGCGAHVRGRWRKRRRPRHPMLGVCLGAQGIGACFRRDGDACARVDAREDVGDHARRVGRVRRVCRRRSPRRDTIRCASRTTGFRPSCTPMRRATTASFKASRIARCRSRRAVSSGVDPDARRRAHRRQFSGEAAAMNDFPRMLAIGVARVAISRPTTRRARSAAIMDETISPVRTAALLAALAAKGETVEEIVGAARAMRERRVRVVHGLPLVVDIVRHGRRRRAHDQHFHRGGVRRCRRGRAGREARQSRGVEYVRQRRRARSARRATRTRSGNARRACCARRRIAFLFAQRSPSGDARRRADPRASSACARSSTCSGR